MNHDAAGAVARLDASESYPARFLRAFGAAPAQGSPPGAVPMSSVPNPPLDAISVAPVPGSPIDADRLARALAAYVATLRPERTRFDDFIEGRADALDDTELLGLHLFRTRARCMNCHGGPLLSDHAFHNIGLSFYGRRNQDLGRYEATRDPADLGKFRTPSLRNVARRPVDAQRPVPRHERSAAHVRRRHGPRPSTARTTGSAGAAQVGTHPAARFERGRDRRLMAFMKVL